LDLVEDADRTGYYAESEFLSNSDKRQKVSVYLQDLIELCERKLGISEDKAATTSKVLGSLLQNIKDSPLESWDQVIAILGDIAGVQALAEYFVATTPDSSTTTIAINGVTVSILELKQVFDQFQRSLKELV